MTYEIHHRGVCDVVRWDEQECVIQRADGRVNPISIHEQPENDFAHHDKNGFISLQKSIDEFVTVEPQLWDRKAILDAIRGSDWRMTLDALEKIGHTKDASIIDAVWELLQREHRLHQTLPTRQADDINWYRLKAAAARVLGAAQFKPATELLGQMLLGADMYPSRVACAWALGQIATPQAKDYLNRVSSDDEWNTMTEAKYWATKK